MIETILFEDYSLTVFTKEKEVENILHESFQSILV